MSYFRAIWVYLVAELAAAQCSGPLIPLTGKTCGPVQPLQLSCSLPSDIVSRPANADAAQRSADIFSWQEFFALNWPVKAGERGVPDDRRPITAPGPRVWETWKESYEVFHSDGSAPEPWNSSQQSPCGAGKLLVRTQKIDDMGIDEEIQAAGSVADPKPRLTDQKGRLVRYEIRMNKVMFDFVVKNKVYNAATQAAFGPVDLPDGAMLIKAAWREAASEEEGRGFYTSAACVCDGGVNGPPVNCRQRQMALVGLHITQRTPQAPQWIWSTFEHADNVPGPGSQGPYSFFNPACPTCPTNQQTEAGTPAQLTRQAPIPNHEPDCAHAEQSVDNIELLNRNVRDALARRAPLFEKYQLIGTQRPLPPAQARPTTAFTVSPETLGNTTMESYVQTTSSCMGCHSTARTSNSTAFASSHFTFMLNDAKPIQPDSNVLQLPDKPGTPWEQQHWPEIQRGKQLATHTYEELKPYVPEAQLHCSTCHLNAGANATAAWWVHLQYRYASAASLETRINLCFTNSLNGKPLCTPASGGNPGNCARSADMQSIVTYMEFLTRVFDAIQPAPPTPTAHGFPAVKNLAGEYCAGEATFRQKCAVCHRLDGQGRYEKGYYRPALWGPHSFNKKAGMFTDPAMLAQFVSWNMPLGAGGLLTDQEAWDVTAFIEAQGRPAFAGAVAETCRK
jgi:cytochrome c